MVWVPSAEKHGFSLRLNEDVMREALNSDAIVQLLEEVGADTRDQVEAHARATASAEDAENYASALEVLPSTSDEYGFDFEAEYALGNRPIVVVVVPPGRGNNTDAEPPLMVEAQTHALTSARGFTAGSSGEDIR